MADFEPEDIPLLEQNYDNEEELEWDDQETSPTRSNVTSFLSPPPVANNPTPRANENQKAKDAFYESVKQLGWNVNVNAPLDYQVLFIKDPKTKHVYAKYKNRKSEEVQVQLTNRYNAGKFLALSTIATNSSIIFVRDMLGVTDYSGGARPKINPQKAAALNQIRDNTPAANDDVPLLDLSDKIDDVHESVENLSIELSKSVREAGIGTDLTYTSQEWRDIIALDKTLQTQKGQINVLISKMAVIDQQIQELNSGAAEDITPDDIEETRKKIAELREKRNTYSELVSTYETKIRSQFSRIKETINRILYQDETLGDRVRTLFREQGVTIASIITALGLAISAIVEGILLATKSAVAAVTPKPPTPKPPSPKPGPDPSPTPGPKPTPKPEGWIKDQLKKIANLLLKLGDKMLIAIPGIVGSIVGFILKSAGTALAFVAEHIWIVLITLGAIYLI